jgi:hypothetical protein
VKTLILLLSTLFLVTGASSTKDLWIDPLAGEVRVAAVAHPDRFQGVLAKAMGMEGYPFLVWDKGRAGHAALLTTTVDDHALYGALDSLGAVAGNALGMDTWEARYDTANPAPDQLIEGSSLWLGIRWPGQDQPLALDRLLHDPGGRGFQFRFGGHLANVPVWKSGCGVCLYSCPGSKVGNAAYTVRDFVGEATRFRIREDAFPAAGTAVEVVFRLIEPKPEPDAPEAD